jgi:hypothetical protein
VLKNVSNKHVSTYVLSCFIRNGKKYKAVDTYASLEGSVAPGAFTHEGGFDATPLNACRSSRGFLAVASVKFDDGTSWISPLMKHVDGSPSR